MEEEWELVIDDDFVFKCPKHPTISSASASSSDPAVEESNRKERKKMTLLKLKKRYQQEICHWEHLSTKQHSSDSVSPEFACSLLLQVEAQEASIKEISALCDVAEALCSAQEQLSNQQFLCLPVWESSPRKLIVLLCDDE